MSNDFGIAKANGLPRKRSSMTSWYKYSTNLRARLYYSSSSKICVCVCLRAASHRTIDTQNHPTWGRLFRSNKVKKVMCLLARRACQHSQTGHCWFGSHQQFGSTPLNIINKYLQVTYDIYIYIIYTLIIISWCISQVRPVYFAEPYYRWFIAVGYYPQLVKQVLTTINCKQAVAWPLVNFDN